ncbi:MAG TPA: Tim44 domain-containing protein [Xanthobacteraceae bacterium]|nr:Tim44 domain-containing protein [Xanthobacteraceae bacterium]
MKFAQRTRALGLLALTLSLALPVMLALSSAADARAGRGGSMGSRGSRTFAPPAATQTAPKAAQPMQRSITQPGAPAAPAAAAAKGGMFGGARGMLGGLAAGFLGAGLLGMLFGNGFMSGLGGFASILGLIAQVILVVVVARLALNWWRRRNAAPAGGPAGSAPMNFGNAQDAPGAANAAPRSALGGGLGGFGLGGAAGAAAPATAPLEVTPDDYDAFERMLGDVQTAWSNEDMAKLEKLVTPEMGSYFAQDLADNKAKGVVNRITDVKLLQGDLAEAWREGNEDYATVAMRFSLVDRTFERDSQRLVEGSDTPVETTEIWTFVRPQNGNWELSGIQQA